MKLFRKSIGPADLVLAMCGVKLGERLLIVGAGVESYFATLASKVGLTGRAAAVTDSERAAEYLRAAAARVGTLLEIEATSLQRFPFDDESFDLGAIDGDMLGRLTPNARVRALQEVKRVLRHGGRAIIIQLAPRGGLGALLSRRSHDIRYEAFGGPSGALSAEGFRPVRTLGEREGLLFVEGLKPGQV